MLCPHHTPWELLHHPWGHQIRKLLRPRDLPQDQRPRQEVLEGFKPAIGYGGFPNSWGICKKIDVNRTVKTCNIDHI